MNTSHAGGTGAMEDPSPEEIMSALFANMVIQNTNMALMFLGKVPHPQTGQTIKDLESAQMFIDQLEMLAYKTRGNLDQDEKRLLQESLISLRITFVEELRRSGIPVPEHLSEAYEDAHKQMQQVIADRQQAEAASKLSAPAPAQPAGAAPTPQP